jgi:hypothetical protein
MSTIIEKYPAVQPRPSARADQVKTRICSPDTVMRHPHFVRGLDDIRAGRPFADDVDDHLWAYERGRLFGAVAPRSMRLFNGKRLNPKELQLFSVASNRGLIP